MKPTKPRKRRNQAQTSEDQLPPHGSPRPTEPKRRISGFKVQKTKCATCIYRKDSPLDLKVLEAQIADDYGGFRGFRICHHSKDACCSGFWKAHKDEFQMGQIAQRLGMVQFVFEDILH
jgi:hypothetical protein